MTGPGAGCGAGLLFALLFTNNTYLIELYKYVLDNKCGTGGPRRSLVDAARDLGVCFDASRWGKVHSRGATVRFGPEKNRTRSIRNKIILDTNLSQLVSAPPFFVFRIYDQQQRDDASLLRDQHVERAASGARIHHLEADAGAQELCAEFRGRKYLARTGADEHELGLERQDRRPCASAVSSPALLTGGTGRDRRRDRRSASRGIPRR